MGIKHPFVSSVIDIGGPTYVQPTHWNSAHNAPPFQIYEFNPGLAPASFGIPSTAGPTGMEVPANTPGMRGAYDFTFVDTLQLYAGVASSNVLGSGAIRFQYSPSGFPGSWYSFDATAGSGPFVSVASGNNASLGLIGSVGMLHGPSVTVSGAAKALPQPLTVRLAAYGGNGSAIGLGNAFVFGS